MSKRIFVDFLLVVSPAGCPVISLSPPSLPAFTVGVPLCGNAYCHRGCQPVAFSIASGSLPPSIALSMSGVASANLGGRPPSPATISSLLRWRTRPDAERQFLTHRARGSADRAPGNGVSVAREGLNKPTQHTRACRDQAVRSPCRQMTASSSPTAPFTPQLPE